MLSSEQCRRINLPSCASLALNPESVKKIFLTLGLLLPLGAGTVSAQVVVSGFEEVELQPKNLREVVELELNQYQAEAEKLNRTISAELTRRKAEWKNENQALQEFLKLYRKDIERSRLDISQVVKQIREEFKTLKQEHKNAIRISKNDPPARINTKGRRNKRKFERISSVQIASYDYLRDTGSPVSRLPAPDGREGKKREASIEDRENKRSPALEPQPLASMPLAEQMLQEPLKSHQATLKKLSDRLKSLTVKIQRDPGNARRHLLDLGNTHLESQRFLNNLSRQDRLALMRHAAVSGTRIGSYEMALWALKSALTLNPNDGTTNLLISEIHQEMGNPTLALERARNAHHIFQKNRFREKAGEAQSRIESLSFKAQTTPQG